MMSCEDAAAYIVRLSDDGESIDATMRARLEAHVQTCESCRASLETQRAVSACLRSRPAERVSAAFAARLSQRLDEASGWLGIADWRTWTLRLTPVAALLLVFVLLGAGPTATSPTIDDWALGVEDDASAAALLLQPDVNADSLMETIVTGEASSGGEGAGNVRQ